MHNSAGYFGAVRLRTVECVSLRKEAKCTDTFFFDVAKNLRSINAHA